MTIGAHTRTHPQLDLLGATFREPELTGSREDLEAILGESVRHLAYPNPGGNGAIERPVRDAAASCGFQTAVTSVTGPIDTGTDLLRLPRLGVYAGDQEQQLFSTLERLH
jgi:peptidoglycan/xylan/chitin deacetylase (PgdA/CDA1 family)